MDKEPETVAGRTQARKPAYCMILAVVMMYVALAIYLYWPYLSHFRPSRYIIILNSIVAACGCFVLSRRWISTYPASFFAGAVYGFCPFSLGFGAYHPLAAFGFAALPWLFYPAAFWSLKYQKTSLTQLVSGALSLLPFAVIALFFWLISRPWVGPFFPLPKQLKFSISNLSGLVAPFAQQPQKLIFGFYHVPVAVGLMGLFMYVAVHRIKPMIIVAAGFCLSLAEPFFSVSPIVWLSIPVLYCSILVGLGTQGLAWAGRADSKWLWVCIIVVGALVLTSSLLWYVSDFDKAYGESAKMHALALVLVGSMFFITRSETRWHFLRWFLLCAGLSIDILLGARFIVDKLH